MTGKQCEYDFMFVHIINWAPELSQSFTQIWNGHVFNSLVLLLLTSNFEPVGTNAAR